MAEQSEKTSSFEFVMTPIRESRLLGKRFQFERSTASGFSPETMCRVVAGRSLSSIVETSFYNYSLALKALERSEGSGAKMHMATRGDLEKLLSQVEIGGDPLSIEGLRRMPDSLHGPWRILRFTMGKRGTRIWRRLFTRLAYYDRVSNQLAKVQDPLYGSFAQAVFPSKRSVLA